MSTCRTLTSRLGALCTYHQRYMSTSCLRRIYPSVLSSVRPPCYREFSNTAVRNVIFTSPIPDIHIKEESLAEYLLPEFERFGNKTALVDDSAGKSYTYLGLRDAVIKLSSALHRLGYKKGDVLCMCSTNSTEYAILILACVTSGIILTTTNPVYTSGEIVRHFHHSGASGVVVTKSLLPNVQEALASDSSLQSTIKNIIVVGDMEGYRSFSSLLSDDGTCFPENLMIDPNEDVALLPYSSGTTGLPKGVMLTHMNIVSNLQQTRPQFAITNDDSVLCLLPMFHAYGMLFILMNTLQDGGKLVILPEFEPESFLTSIQQHKVSLLYMVPPIALFLARHPLVDKFDISSIRAHLCAAAPLGESLCLEYEKRLKYPVVQGYGMTELSPVATLDTLPPHHVGTVGELVPNTSAKFLCLETGAELGPGKTGELCIRGPQVMKGYLNNEKATKEMIIDGWLHTGDVGYVREDGSFMITDRLKELIKYKGFQVAPAELEDVLLRHPGVQDVAVIGVPDERAGEIPRAYIVPKPNSKYTPEDISKFVEEKRFLLQEASRRSRIPRGNSKIAIWKNSQTFTSRYVLEKSPIENDVTENTQTGYCQKQCMHAP
ncbi:4-coumarate--CoA ligase 1-like [Pecten maximus]|uniref:4-coumarate--CoA ligase 1-like n=1 Tax=Pecten maximus TaxID=6579 RepID=UPI001458B7A1|nr:4-coumarate--CoA ligase 1-like [Pecten maximus]